MKNDDGSLFDIMQDPLLTMVAIILFGTLWIIIPGGRGSADGVDSKELRSRLAELEQVLSVMEQQILGVQNTIKTEEKDQAKWAKSALMQERQVKANIDQTKNEIEALNTALKEKSGEYAELQTQLEEAASYQPEAALIEELQRRIDKLEEEIYKKGSVVRELDSSITKAVQREGLNGSQPHKVKKENVKILREIDLVEARVKNLQTKKEELTETLQKKHGTGEYSTAGTSGKEALAFEADEGKLYLIDNDNYEVRKSGYIETDSGRVSASNIGRKNNATGDASITLDEASSIFKTKLSHASPYKDYIIFLVRKDSFGLFLNARLIAEQAGFRVGWIPYGEGPILTSESASGPVVR